MSLDYNSVDARILVCLKLNGILSRMELVNKLKEPRTTVHDNLSKLVKEDKIKKFSRQVNDRGRPVVFYKLKD